MYFQARKGPSLFFKMTLQTVSLKNNYFSHWSLFVVLPGTSNEAHPISEIDAIGLSARFVHFFFNENRSTL